MMENKQKYVLNTALLIVIIALVLAAVAYVIRITMSAKEMYDKVNSLQTIESSETEHGSAETLMEPTETETVHWKLNDQHTFTPDKVALPTESGKIAVVDVSDYAHKSITAAPSDAIVSVTRLCSIRTVPSDTEIPSGIKVVSDETGRCYITAAKKLDDQSMIVVNQEAGASFKDSRVEDSQHFLDNVSLTNNISYTLEECEINPEALSGTVFSPYCIYYDGEKGKVVIQDASFKLPVAGYNRANRLKNWVVYSGVFDDEQSETDLFLIDTGKITLKAIASDIETLYWFFDERYNEESAYDEKILDSDIANMLSANSVGSLNGLNFFVPQESPEYSKDGMTEKVVTEREEKQLTVGAGQKVWLELDGGSIDCIQRDGFAVVVAKGGELVITGHGQIINSRGKSAILNEGICNITGDVEIESNHGRFAVVNHGTMEIGGNVQITGNEEVEYVIDNGFHDKKSVDRTECNYNGETTEPDLKIFNGTFHGNSTVLQNDEDGYTYVYGGTFENDTFEGYLIGNKGVVLEIVGGEYHFAGSLFELGQTVPNEASTERTYVLGGTFKVMNSIGMANNCLFNIPIELLESDEFQLAHGPIFILGGEFQGIDKYYNMEMDGDVETQLKISDLAYFGRKEIAK